MYTLEIVLLLLLLVLSAFFSGIEIALVSVSKVKVRTFLALKKKGAKTLAKLKKHPKRMIITILIGNNIVNTASAAYTAVLLTSIIGSAAVGVATGIVTLLILTFGEILPKTYFAKHADYMALKFAKPIYILSIALFPLVWIFEKLAKIVAPDGEHKITEQEIKSLIELGAEGAVLHKKQEQLMKSVFEFDDIRVHDIMTPRIEVFAQQEDLLVKDVMDAIKEEGHSRILTFKENIDSTVGYFHIRDILGISPNTKLKTIAHPVTFVSSEKIIQELFLEMQKNRNHLCVVVDEFGGVAGIVTMEDILEELVGEIQDENDEHEVYIKKLNKNTYMVTGDAEIDDVNEELGLKLQSGSGHSTIGGYIQYKLKDLPDEGETVETAKATLEVEKATDTKIDLVKIITKTPKKLKKA
ncbi:MAG: hemolysin family protein [Candidatus Woesearchaeota archaeon]